MRWFKVAAIVVGVMIAFLVVSSVIGFLIEAVIAVLAVGVIVLGLKVAVNRRLAPGRTPSRQVRGPGSSRSPHRPKTPNVEDDLAHLKRETGG